MNNSKNQEIAKKLEINNKSSKKVNKLLPFYEEMFTSKFLINYGYFDITPFKKQSIKSLNDYGKSDSFYLKIFNLNKLTEYFVANKETIEEGYFNLKKKISTEPISFTIPKNNGARREYKMPNIYSYLDLMVFMQKKKI